MNRTADATLLLTPEGALEAGECHAALTAGDPADTAVLLVSLAEPPGVTLHRLDTQAGSLPARVGIVSVGEEMRGAASAATAGAAPGNSRIRIETVGDTRDLTGIGMAVEELLPFLRGPDRLVVCVDSLTPLVLSTDERRTFRFVRTLTHRLKAVGADVHAHLDPAAHGDRTVATLRSPFDEVARPE